MPTQANIDPQQILDLLRSDRERGTALLLEAYTPLLWAVCQRRLSDPEDIKECINDVFTEFCMNPERYDPEQLSLKNYLAMIADRRAISCYRSNQRRDLAESASGMSQEQLDERSQLHSQLEEALSQLQSEDAQIIRLKYYGGMTYGEIAQSMGITEDAAKKRGHRSLRKIAKWFLIGTILALLLAGCAYVAHQYFRYSRNIGLTWGEETHVYQMTQAPEAISVCGVDFHLLNASYAEDALSLTVAVFLSEDSEISPYHIGLNASINGGDFTSTSTSSGLLHEYLIALPWDSLTPAEDGSLCLTVQMQYKTVMPISPFTEEEAAAINAALHWDILLEEAEAQEDLTSLGYYLETTHTDFLVMTDQEVPDNDQGDFTIISLYPMYTQENYTLATPLTTYFQVLEGYETQVITLTDDAGNSYPVYRIMSPSRGATEYGLWFQDVPPGEYTLNIPRLVYTGTAASVTFTLPAPTEDGVTVPCDQLLTFADGTTVHFTGVSRTTERRSGNFMVESWVDGVQNWEQIQDMESFWSYFLEYEISTDPAFPLFGYTATVELSYLTENGYEAIAYRADMSSPAFRSTFIQAGLRDGLEMPDPEGLTVTVLTPAYVDQQTYSIRVTVE